MIIAFLAGMRFQAELLRRSWPDMMALLLAPIFTVAFISIMLYAHRPDLTTYAVLGPSVIAIWSMALSVSGEVLDSERHNGTFEATLTTPVSLPALVLGRTTTVTLVSLLSLAESVLVARVLFDITVGIPHDVVFAATILATALAMAGTATAMCALFVTSRSARTFQNSLSYPFYLLSGAVVPPALLPAWLQPVTRIVFLSWSTDLLRAALNTTPVPHLLPRLGMIVLLGALGYTGGLWLMRTVLRRMRSTGSVSLA